MTWTCPICKTENNKTWLCTCGFDETKNYEKYPTLSNLPVKMQSVLNIKNALKYLCTYAKNKETKKAEEILKLYPSVINKKIVENLNHYNILSYAVNEDWDIAIIELLLRYGADPNSVDGWSLENDSSFSALGYAMFLKRKNILTFFLENGVSPNRLSCWKTNDAVFSALGCAILTKNMEMVYLLIKHGADVNGFHKHQDNRNISALGMVIELKNTELAQILLECGADPNRSQNEIGKMKYSSFGYAIFYKNIEMIKIFIEHNKFYKDIDGVDSEIKEHLFEEYIADMEFVGELNQLGWSKLVDIQKIKDTDILDQLISAGKENNTNYVKRLLDSHPEVLLKRVTIGENSYSILSYAVCKEWNRSIIELLLKYEADPDSYRIKRNEVGKNQYSALSDAIWNKKDKELVELLLKYGANPNRVETMISQKDVFCDNMLSYAIRYTGNIEIVKLLLKYGATWDNVVYLNGIKESVRNYPYETYKKDQTFLIELKKLGWKK